MKREFNNGRPFHGCEVEEGRLMGATDTDYFYFFCPKCGDSQIMQILDYKVVCDGPVEYAKDERPGAKRDFIIAFQLRCSKCRLTDFVKVANIGWQGGRLSDSPIFGLTSTPPPFSRVALSERTQTSK
jgi:predicted RNA-binding Zn-ribbon protein involved in translation (DUF1610 family)